MATAVQNRLGIERSSRGPIATRPPRLVPENFTQSRFIDWKRKGSGFETSTNAQITDEIRDRVISGDRIFVVMNGKIGDMIQATAFIKGLAQVRQMADIDDPNITVVMTNPAFKTLFSPFAKKYGIKIDEKVVTDGDGEVRAHIANTHAKKPLVIEFDSFHGEPSVEKFQRWSTRRANDSPSLDAIIVRDFFIPFSGLYTNTTGGEGRYARFIERFLGLEEATVGNVLPEITLSRDANAKFAKICEREGIDYHKRQIAIMLEASNPGRMYDRYDEVVTHLRRNLPDAEINMLFDPKRAVDDPQRQEWQKIADSHTNGKVRLMSVSLDDAPTFLANMSVVVGADSGMAQIAGSAVGGPNVIPLYIPPEVNPDVWEINPDRIHGISAPINPDVDADSDGLRCSDPAIKRINRIPPESIASRAVALIRSALERPSYTSYAKNAVPAISAIISDVLGRAAHPAEIERYGIHDRQEVPQVADALRRSMERTRMDINNLYLQIFGRNVDPDGFSAYASELQRGRTLGSLRKILIESREAQIRFANIAASEIDAKKGRAKAIDAMYRAILGRPVDAEGRKTYIENTNVPAGRIIDTLVNSDEFKLGYLLSGRNKNAVWIEDAYRTMVGHEIPIEILEHYLQKVTRGTTIVQVRGEFLMSGLALNRIQELAHEDRAVAVEMLYKIILGRDADSSGKSFYANSQMTIEQIYQVLIESKEFTDKYIGQVKKK